MKIEKIVKLNITMRYTYKILNYNNNLKINNFSLNEKLLSSFNDFINIKKINFNTSELSRLDTLSLVKIICIISPLDDLIKQMMLEFNNIDELCNNLLSVLEIEINNKNNNFKIVDPSKLDFFFLYLDCVFFLTSKIKNNKIENVKKFIIVKL